jgi:hypothetical protein
MSVRGHECRLTHLTATSVITQLSTCRCIAANDEKGQSRPLLHCKISGQDGTLRFIRRALPCPAPSASEAPTLR